MNKKNSKRADFWINFILNEIEYPDMNKLSEHLKEAILVEDCHCGCNSYKVAVNKDTIKPLLGKTRKAGCFFEATYDLVNDPEKCITFLFFCDDAGYMERIEIDCCANTFPVPFEIEIKRPAVDCLSHP